MNSVFKCMPCVALCKCQVTQYGVRKDLQMKRKGRWETERPCRRERSHSEVILHQQSTFTKEKKEIKFRICQTPCLPHAFSNIYNNSVRVSPPKATPEVKQIPVHFRPFWPPNCRGQRKPHQGLSFGSQRRGSGLGSSSCWHSGRKNA